MNFPRKSTKDKANETPPVHDDTPPRLVGGANERKKSKDGNWRGFLQKNKQGTIVPNEANVTLILNHHPDWDGVFVFDEFIGDIVAVKLAPWPPDIRPEKHVIADWTHDGTVRLGIWLSREEQLHGSSNVGAALRIVAQRKTAHPIREFLKSQRWDKQKRVDGLFVRAGGADDTPYTRAVAANFMISAVARVMEPGCKVDTMPILEGAQGIRKSTFLRELFSPSWFTDTPIQIGDKDGYQALRRKWCMEISELDSFKGKEATAIKVFVSGQVDRYRPSYGKDTLDFPRQIVFAGTTNASTYLNDETGARRFQPVKFTRNVDIEWVKANRDQLWAEAFARYQAGENWYITDETIIAAAAAATDARQQRHPWAEALAEWFTTEPAAATRGITTHEALTGIGVPIERQDRRAEMQMAQALDDVRLRRSSHRVRRGGHQVYVYLREPTLAAVPSGKQNAPTPLRRIARTAPKVVSGRLARAPKSSKK